jgi:hypothetical protein
VEVRLPFAIFPHEGSFSATFMGKFKGKFDKAPNGKKIFFFWDESIALNICAKFSAPIPADSSIS